MVGKLPLHSARKAPFHRQLASQHLEPMALCLLHTVLPLEESRWLVAAVERPSAYWTTNWQICRSDWTELACSSGDVECRGDAAWKRAAYCSQSLNSRGNYLHLGNLHVSQASPRIYWDCGKKLEILQNSRQLTSISLPLAVGTKGTSGICSISCCVCTNSVWTSEMLSIVCVESITVFVEDGFDDDFRNSKKMLVR